MPQQIPLTGQLTIPTDVDVVQETLDIMRRWGADALRDCDGTDFPKALRNTGAKVYATYYTTRKDNAWAKQNPDEVQQCYIMTAFHTAAGEDPLHIPLLKGINRELMQVNERDDRARWWEVIDRTTGEVVPPPAWTYADGCVTVLKPTPFHEYTVSFLAYLIWDPVHMYNALVNQWQGVEHQITFDVRQPKTRAFSLKRLEKFLLDNPHVSVVRFTTFFHQFTLIFDELGRQKYVDWYGYSASVSPYILAQFEQEMGYRFRPEYIIDQGYYNNQYRVPSKEYRDFQAFQRREVAALAKEMVDLTHKMGREAMMFLGDHFIGTEPFMDEFKTIGLDAVVGSVGNGSTLRLISDIPGVRYTEGRLLPYFFPDTFYEGGDPVKEAKENWITARRALLRRPLDRIGYGGYLKLALQFPDFVDYVEKVAAEFRLLYRNIGKGTPFCHKKVAVLNAWGRQRAWGCHMVHHALYQKENISYAGVIEALSGAPLDVSFISFEDIKRDPAVLKNLDVLINVGDQDTAHTGGLWWEDAQVVSAIRQFVYEGGGFIGVGEPSAHPKEGRVLQLAGLMQVEKETGFTLGYSKFNWEEHRDHFILRDAAWGVDFGEAKKGMYPLENATVLWHTDKELNLAAASFGKGRSVYISGLPYSFPNARLLLRAVLWSAGHEEGMNEWTSQNPYVDVHAYLDSRKYCVVNNTDQAQTTTVFETLGRQKDMTLAPGEICWYPIC